VGLDLHLAGLNLQAPLVLGDGVAEPALSQKTVAKLGMSAGLNASSGSAEVLQPLGLEHGQSPQAH
jgi:hypothetical protein